MALSDYVRIISFLTTIFLPLLLVIRAEYTEFYDVETDPTWHDEVLSTFDQIPVSEDNHLASNLLLYSHTPSCHKIVAESWSVVYPSLREAYPLEGAIHEAYFGYKHGDAGNDHGSCASICLIKGMRAEHLMYPLPDQTWFQSKDQVDGDAQMYMNEFLHKCQRVEVGFVNVMEEDLAVWLVTGPESIEYQGELKPGDANTMWQDSTIGHTYQFALHDSDDVIAEHVVEHDLFYVVGDVRSGLMNITMRTRIRRTLDREWGRSRRVKRTFTALGFDRSKLPRDLFASMATYYYNNQNNLMLEDWESDGYLAHVNWWEVDVFMVGMPWGLKRYWQARLKDLVEAWSGVELELTDIYGMRRYEDGARLLSHVDREATHAASLIINIAQGNVRDPWAIEIYDHANRLHEITMEEGDIVYYESARCLHGRMKPLVGGFYVNLFAHYRPIGDSEWFLKTNPVDGVPPLIDLGDCHKEGDVTKCNGHGAQHVPFLTYPLSTIDGPDGLFSYWEHITEAYGLPDQSGGELPPGDHPEKQHDEL